MIQMFRRARKRNKYITFDKQDYLKSYFINENNEAIVRVYIDNVEEMASEYSGSVFAVLDQGLADYMDQLIYHIPLKFDIVLCFIVKNGLTDETKEKVTDMIKNHYGLIYEDKCYDLKINLLIIWALFLIGSLLLTFSYYLSATGMEQLFTDTINIAGTFALWEMVDLYLLDRKAKTIELKNAAQTFSSKIIFYSNS